MKDVKWKLKKDTCVYTDEFWYDLTDGGYINVFDILEDREQAIELQEAIDLVRSFEQAINGMDEN